MWKAVRFACGGRVYLIGSIDLLYTVVDLSWKVGDCVGMAGA